MRKIFKWMKPILLPSIILFNLASCQKETEGPNTIASEKQAHIKSKSGFNTPDQIHFTQFVCYPEGVAFDRFNNRFLVSSFASPDEIYLGTGTIGAVSWGGNYTSLIYDPDLKSMAGIHIDEARKRVVVAIQNGWFGDGAKVGAYDLVTGKRIWLIDLAALHPGGAHFADDLAIDPDGNIYITDLHSPAIYKVDINGHASIFFENDFFAEPEDSEFPFWFGFNGIVYDNSGFLIVAFMAGSLVDKPSLVKIPAKDPQHFSGVQLDVPIVSPDGLLLSRDGKELIIVDNNFGGEGEIVHMSSKDKWISATRIESFSTGANLATTATSDGKDVFVIYPNLGIPDLADYTIQKMPFNFNSVF